MLIWKDVHSVGKFEIDEEHKQIFDMINILDEQNKFDENVFTELLNLLEKHFENEECFMRDIGFPNYKFHEYIHKETLEIISQMRDELKTDKEKEKIQRELIKYLRDHIINHILGDDKEYREWYKIFLKENGACD